ncbi:hypothetical protein [Rugosimonospora africana]|uniref:Uncharacterized protein n=1 Tax=Rugosimonospora africana TaxID=556532 RepID=A0A8J3QR59_9ACTN|nr:hypothetical protein [Rugosimonospora africana]GIH15915.1 hypothetical protein Raf01_40870 [Rugosimonospora africana]
MLFVYRSHYEGPLSRRVRRLPDRGVLDWFRRGWHEPDPDAWADRELGGDVYGLWSVFAAAHEHELPMPETTEELRALLDEHLYVEGDAAENIRFDGSTLRVKTDDDEVDLAYLFVDDASAAAAPNRWAYPLHAEWPLPADATDTGRGFTTDGIPVETGAPDAGGVGRTYLVFLTFDSGESFLNPLPMVFPGVRLPDLAAVLRRAMPRPMVGERDGWPWELRVLRALVAPTEATIDAALGRCNRWPGFDLNAPSYELPDDYAAAHSAATEVLDATDGYTAGRDPDRTLLRVDEHLAQLCLHLSEAFGFQQWFVFDDLWAEDHPELAESLLRYAAHWDPLQG